MSSFFIVSLFSLFLAVQALVIETKSCFSPDVFAIAQQVSSPHYFCTWYLSDGRTNSPIPNIDATALLSACKCIASAEPVGTKAKTLDAIAKAASLHSYVSATCQSTSGSPISREFMNPPLFCTFFNSYERHDSPIPSLNVPAVRHACKCVLSGPKSSSKTSSTIKSPSSSTKQTTSHRSSSPSTKESSSRTSSAVTRESSSKPTVHKTISSKPSSSRVSSRTQTSSSKISTRSVTIKTSSSKSFSSKLPSTKIPSESTSRKSSISNLSSQSSSLKQDLLIQILEHQEYLTINIEFKEILELINTYPENLFFCRIYLWRSSQILDVFIIEFIEIIIFELVVGGPYDGAYLSTRYQVVGGPMGSYDYVFNVITVVPGSSIPAVFGIDPTTQFLEIHTYSKIPYGIYSPDSSHQQIWPQSKNTTPMLCKDVEGYLHCETADGALDVFAAEGSWSYLTTQSWQSTNSPEYVAVKYQIVYQPISAATSTTTSAIQTTSTSDAYDVITSQNLEAYCTTYLGYTTPSITETTTLFANTTKTDVFNLTVTSTIVSLSTETDIVGTITVTSLTSTPTDAAPGKRRDIDTPYVLRSYAESAINSGCSRAATQPAPTTFFETVTVASNEIVASTTTAIAYENITSVVTELITFTTTTILSSSTSSSATCTPTPIVDAEQQAKDLAALNFLFTHNNLTSMLSSFPISVLGGFQNITGDVLPPIRTALQNWVPCTATSYNISTQLLACKDETYVTAFAACIIFRTDPYSLKWAGTTSYTVPVPVSALTKTWRDYENTVVGKDGVAISPNMSLIEVIDHATNGGHYASNSFKNLQYYFKEGNILTTGLV
ncbi:unnamed protein product [Aureobasidium uvarum]|uniref:Uncharacterized protein n=1 Tax=Aureobasidium uvarum TaxID=2773716 RepID=A0A9N8PSX8_9PEZI|nr:unnamed protein product [Aureobasidium uvarum]